MPPCFWSNSKLFRNSFIRVGSPPSGPLIPWPRNALWTSEVVITEAWEADFIAANLKPYWAIWDLGGRRRKAAYHFCCSIACAHILSSLSGKCWFLHCQYFHCTVGLYFLAFTGNRDDIEWHDLRDHIFQYTPCSLGRYFPWDSISPYTPLGEYQEHILARKTLTMLQQRCRKV